MIQSSAICLVVIALVLVCTAGCDQVTKHFARTELGGAGFIASPGRFVEFTLAENPGGFLSFGASLPKAARSVLIGCTGVGLAFLLAYLARTSKLRLISFFGLALVWAGGVSNLFDRLARHGLVTDFLVVRAGPLHTGIFNVADFAIMLGILLFVASFGNGLQRDKFQQREKVTRK